MMIHVKLKKNKITVLIGQIHCDFKVNFGQVYKSLISIKLSKFSQLSFCQKLIFCELNSFIHMVNVSKSYRQSIKLFHQKL